MQCAGRLGPGAPLPATAPPPELHRAVALAAARANKSLNAWVTETLARTVAG